MIGIYNSSTNEEITSLLELVLKMLADEEFNFNPKLRNFAIQSILQAIQNQNFLLKTLNSGDEFIVLDSLNVIQVFRISLFINHAF